MVYHQKTQTISIADFTLKKAERATLELTHYPVSDL